MDEKNSTNIVFFTVELDFFQEESNFDLIKIDIENEQEKDAILENSTI